jgi:hypothetical protein
MRQTTDDPITEAECWALLAGASVGRLALSLQALPAILPVQYYLDGERIALCLARPLSGSHPSHRQHGGGFRG